MEQNYAERRRVSFSVSVKGIVTPEVTFEDLTGKSNEEVVKEASDLLEKALKVAQEKSVKS